MTKFLINKREYICPLQLALSVMSGKWKGLILWFLLENSVLRFSELKSKIHEVTKITDKMLIQCLKELESDDLVNRNVYKVVPPKVEYSITDLGKKLKPVIDELEKFGLEFESK